MKTLPNDQTPVEQSTVVSPETPKQPQFITQTNRHPEQGMLVHRDEATKKLVDAETKTEIIEKKKEK